MSSPRISIVSHTYGRSQHLKDMVESVRAFTPAGMYEIIVVSSDPPETEKVLWLKQQPDVVFVQADIRRPWQLRKQSAYHYINCGMQQAKHEWVVVFNDDMVATPQWYTDFAALASDPAHAQVGMIIPALYLSKRKYGRRLVTIGKTKKSGESWKELYLADMAIMRRDIFARIGFYDDQLDWAGGGVDLALAFEFLSNTRILTTQAIDIDHRIAQEGRSSTISNDLAAYHYIHQKWDAWCAENECEYMLDDPGIPPYTPLNRTKDYLRRTRKVLLYYWRWLRMGAPRR